MYVVIISRRGGSILMTYGPFDQGDAGAQRVIPSLLEYVSASVFEGIVAEKDLTARVEMVCTPPVWVRLGVTDEEK